MAANNHERYNYSTLEVVPGETNRDDQAPQVVQNNDGPEVYKPEAQVYKDDPNAANGGYKSYADHQADSGAALPEVVNGGAGYHYGEAGAAEAGLGAGSGVGAGAGAGAGAAAAVPAAERRILGMKRKTFFIVLAIALVVVIGALAGGLAGGLTSRKSGSGGENGGGDDGGGGGGGGNGTIGNGTVNAKPTSKLTALNWTDTSKNTYRAVFWQNSSTAALMMSLWDSKNATWDSINVGDSLAASGLSIKALTGTPLSAAVRATPNTSTKKPFQITLFYLSPSNTVQQIVSNDIRGTTWALGDLSKSTNVFQAAKGSALAAWWELCATKCDGFLKVFYESPSQALVYGNESNWDNGPFGVETNPIVHGSGIAVTDLTPFSGTQGPDNDSPRVYTDDSNVLHEWMSNRNSPWSGASTISRQLPADAPPQFAAQSFVNVTAPAAGHLSIVAVCNFANGTILANYWNNYTWYNGGIDPDVPLLTAVNMNGTAQQYNNFSSIALTQDLKFLGLTDQNEIHMWTIDRKDPLSWTYDSKVGSI